MWHILNVNERLTNTPTPMKNAAAQMCQTAAPDAALFILKMANTTMLYMMLNLLPCVCTRTHPHLCAK